MIEKTYHVDMAGTITVTATSIEEAKQKAWEMMPTDEITPRLVTEGECAECGGTGEVATDEDDGEGHTMRGVGSQPCICQSSSKD